MPLHKLPRTMLTLAKREAVLRTLLTRRASEYQLLKAAEKVRIARIQVLRARIGDMPSVIRTAQQNKQVAKLEQQVDLLRVTTPMGILAEFRPAAVKPAGHA
jgi:hypothetical protein